MIAARCCGAAARLIEDATAFVQDRDVAGEPLSNKQMIQGERFFWELRVDRIWEGTSEIQRLIIAGCLLKRGLGGL